LQTNRRDSDKEGGKRPNHESENDAQGTRAPTPTLGLYARFIQIVLLTYSQRCSISAATVIHVGSRLCVSLSKQSLLTDHGKLGDTQLGRRRITEVRSSVGERQSADSQLGPVAPYRVPRAAVVVRYLVVEVDDARWLGQVARELPQNDVTSDAAQCHRRASDSDDVGQLTVTTCNS